MTMQMPILPRQADGAATVPGFAPPRAPLAMPKQVLAPEPRALRRRLAGLISALMPGRRRPG